MDTEMEETKDDIRESAETLENERRAHDRTRSEVREAQAIVAERSERINAQERELQELRRQTEQLRIEAATLTERVAHVEELRILVRTLQEQ